VVAVERHAASGVKGSGAEGRVRHSFACLFTFRDGKVSQVKEYATRGEALKAAGLSE
jgi:ketosteroid isomerase-like protein